MEAPPSPTTARLRSVTTASFGLALLEADVGVEEPINRADKALYAATAAGRDRVLAWDSPASSTG